MFSYPNIVADTRLSAPAPIQLWNPNQTMAGTDRTMAGMRVPAKPKADRACTMNGMPYLCPACAVDHQGESDHDTAYGDREERLEKIQGSDQTGPDREGPDRDAAAQPSEEVGPRIHDPGRLGREALLAYALFVEGFDLRPFGVDRSIHRHRQFSL